MPSRDRKLKQALKRQQLADSAEEKNANSAQQALTHAHQEAFLIAFCEIGVVAHAAKEAKVDRSNVYGWLERDPAFVEAYQEAIKVAHDKLVTEARRRAVDGYDEYLTSKDGLIMDPNDPTKPLMQRRFSDGLLKFLIERHEGKPGQNLNITSTNTSKIEITKKEVTVQLVADVTKLLVEAGLGSNDPASLADAARATGEPVDSALALAKASRVPKSAA